MLLENNHLEIALKLHESESAEMFTQIYLMVVLYLGDRHYPPITLSTTRMGSGDFPRSSSRLKNRAVIYFSPKLFVLMEWLDTE
jgi:hypothetical protein